MFVNSCMLNLRSEEVLGIPIIVKLSKKGEIKTIYSIPYSQIATYLSNIRGYFVGDGYSVKGVSLRRLIEYGEEFGLDNWYSIEAVKVFSGIETDDSIDKNVVAWYNPYMHKVVYVTDIYGQLIEKDAVFKEVVCHRYLAKNSGDCDYFLPLHNYPASHPCKPCDNIGEYFCAEPSIRSSISKIEEFIKNSALSVDSPLLGKFRDVISQVPTNRFMEICVFSAIEKALVNSYMSSDCRRYISIYSNEPYSIDEINHHTRGQIRCRVARMLFYQNSILAFKALLDSYECIAFENIGKSIFKNHFSQASQSNDWLSYTESIYRIIALCIGFKSVGVGLIQRTRDRSSLSHSIAMGEVNTCRAFDYFLGYEKALFASIFGSCFKTHSNYSVVIGNVTFDYRHLERFVTDMLRMFYRSQHIAFNGNMLAYYKNGKEFYEYAKI